MEIKRIIVGLLEENCYIITKNKQSIIIDPGDDADKIIKACVGKNIVGVLITHHHFDHIGALGKIESYFNIQENNCPNNFGWEKIDTPGHTKDSVCYYFKDEKVLFSGDFLFLNSIGRTDLETGSDDDMQKSLEKISTYDADIIIYPGHGENTILGYEKNNFKYYYK